MKLSNMNYNLCHGNWIEIQCFTEKIDIFEVLFRESGIDGIIFII